MKAPTTPSRRARGRLPHNPTRSMSINGAYPEDNINRDAPQSSLPPVTPESRNGNRYQSATQHHSLSSAARARHRAGWMRTTRPLDAPSQTAGSDT
ncbi:uncharacterized protein PG986_008507 [Apiospora aurea]|uniref:Uncharacterized protein n=1 Tax=Apiospora aurea TaxID=335848 RepID=A0ABR1QFN4_9PEZI